MNISKSIIRFNWLQLSQFLVVGIITNALNILTFYLLVFIQVPVVVASAIAYVCGGVLGFNLNKKWTFSHRFMIDKRSHFSGVIYALIQLVTLGLYVTCFSLLNDLFGAFVSYLFIVLPCIAVAAGCNFCLLKIFWSTPK